MNKFYRTTITVSNISEKKGEGVLEVLATEFAFLDALVIKDDWLQGCKEGYLQPKSRDKYTFSVSEERTPEDSLDNPYDRRDHANRVKKSIRAVCYTAEIVIEVELFQMTFREMYKFDK